jgi:rRNA maturation RNase YbeY
MKNIKFYNSVSKTIITNKASIVMAINEVLRRHNRQAELINFIFVNDEELLRLNLEFLKHDTLTDVITFDYSHKTRISCDIYISWERTAENAKKLGTRHQKELERVMFHGVLHCLGYNDKTEAEQALIRKQEDKALKLLIKCAYKHSQKKKEVDE